MPTPDFTIELVGKTTPEEDAKKRIDREDRAAQVKQAYNQQKFGTDYNPAERAKEELKAAKQQARDARNEELNFRQRRHVQNDMEGRASGWAGAPFRMLQKLGLPGMGGAAQIAGSAGKFGVMGAQIASGSAMGGAASLAGLAAGGPVGIAIGAAIGALLVGVNSIKAGFNKINDFANTATQFSGVAAQASAQAEVVRTLKNIERSNAMGEDLAHFIEAQSELEESFQDFLMAILKPFIPIATAVMEMLKGFLEFLTAEVVPGIIHALNELITYSEKTYNLTFAKLGADRITLKKIELNTRPAAEGWNDDPLNIGQLRSMWNKTNDNNRNMGFQMAARNFRLGAPVPAMQLP